MECEVIEKPDREMECDIIPADPPPTTPPPPPGKKRVCEFIPKPIVRESCQDVKMKAFTEKCNEVPVSVPAVDCQGQMMPLALKEICITIDFRLPRQECEKKTREDCRYCS